MELGHRSVGEAARLGIVVSIATAGDLLQWHPHLHLLVSDPARAADGTRQALAGWDASRLMGLFRERLLAGLLENHAVSQELVGKLLAWRYPGFSAHVGEPIAPEEKQKLDHIPDPGQRRALFYGAYANRVRAGAARGGEPAGAAEQAPPRRRSSPSWGRMIAKVYQVDPLLCARCGQRMSIVGFVTDFVAIGRILDHLGLSSPQQEKPPPLHELGSACSFHHTACAPPGATSSRARHRGHVAATSPSPGSTQTSFADRAAPLRRPTPSTTGGR
jgi:hypothetical protein